MKGYTELVSEVSQFGFDALAIHTPIIVSRDVALNYYRNGGVNPWGGVEAKASKLIASMLNKPVAHAPVENTDSEDGELFLIFQNEEIDPRIAAEAISCCYLHCVLKGLNKAPVLGMGLNVRDVDFMVSPWGCFGKPHRACGSAGVPVIAVKENRTVLNDTMPEWFIKVENYLEAAGVIMAMKAGVCRASVRRPLGYTVKKEVGSNE